MIHHSPLLPVSEPEQGANLQKGPLATAHHVSETEVIAKVGNALKSAGESVAMEAPCESAIHARAYQLEMLDKSLDGNIIVAVRSGSSLPLCRVVTTLTLHVCRWTLAVARLKCTVPYERYRLKKVLLPVSLLTAKQCRVSDPP